jgi:hypothetical protein
MLALLAGASAGAGPQRVTPVHAGTGGSPHVRYEHDLAGTVVTIEYGRPALEGRPLEALIPEGRVWRTGADEATVLRTPAALTLGPFALPPGSYSLYTIPAPREWMLIVNRAVGQWGTSYDPARDALRVPMTVRRLEQPVERLTIAIEPRERGGELSISWGLVRASLAIAVQ